MGHSDAMLLYVHQADERPEDNVDVALKNKSNASHFDVVGFKPRYYLLITRWGSRSFNVVHKCGTGSQEERIVNHYPKHWTDSINKVRAIEACLVEDWREGFGF